jgi:diaminohydroxyphosphoribosylaminopyrimidine deaminase/5-amino-6-(5-phosphoribosylamino)uracil reductase
MEIHSAYMHRCLQLAKLGSGYVAPNPLVGALLVYENRIIGEGYHEMYGGPHAEVNCIASVNTEDQSLIASSTLYVSLEPCAHFGKTPPCSNLIIQHKIPKVVVGCRDPFPKVNGKGIEQLQNAGIEVIVGIEEETCKQLNKRFFTFQQLHRPFVVLKWAQSSNLKINAYGIDRLFITNDFSNRLVHKWRSEEASIMVGTNTALADNPALTTRLWSGRHPVRIVVDLDLRLPQDLILFNRKFPTIVFNSIKDEEEENLLYYKVDADESLAIQIMQALFELKLQSVIIEGGSRLLQHFIDEGLWDQICTITNNDLVVTEGLSAPELPLAKKEKEFNLLTDTISIYTPL